MAALLDNVRFNPTAGGTTDWTYSSAVAGYQSPALAGAGNSTKYKHFAISADLTQWELTEGAWNSSTGVLARTTVLYNSAGTGGAPGQSGAGTKINFSAAPTVAIVGIAEDLGSPAIMRGYLSGLALSTAGSSTTFSVAAGVAVDGGNIAFMQLAASISKTTGAWAVGTGNGALDTGAIASSTWYHVHLIKRPDTLVVDVLISLSATSPTLPTGYTLFRRIGSMKTDGSSNWTSFIQDGDLFVWAQPIQDVFVTNPGTAAVSRTLTVPTGIRVQANLAVFGDNGSAGNAPGGIWISDLSIPDLAASAVNFNMYVYAAAAATEYVLGAPVSVMTNTSAQVRSRIQISDATTVLRISTLGWMDRRGRDG